MKESGEMYLETIYRLSETGRLPVKSVDVAKRLAISRPSVNRAVNTLKNDGYIIQQNYGDIMITEKGLAAAERIFFKHCLITQFLICSLSLSPAQAEEDACRIEHVVSDVAVDSMIAYLQAHGVPLP